MTELISFLNFYDIPYKILPKRLEVGGYLDMSHAQISSLPEGLKIRR